MNTEELLDIKNRISSRKEKLQQLQGKESFLKEQMKRKFDCSSVKEATKELERLMKNVDSLKRVIESKAQILTEEYDL
jgi:Tfp pilus assembly protein PilO